jgi:Rieske 2Fe-2S protein
MLVVTFATAGRSNCVVIDGEPFVYARTRLGSFVLPARCRHRGGPLHLAELARGVPRLVCPWHERCTPVSKWLAAGVPAARRGNVVTAVFRAPKGTSYELEHRPLSPDLDASERTTSDSLN